MPLGLEGMGEEGVGPTVLSTGSTLVVLMPLVVVVWDKRRVVVRVMLVVLYGVGVRMMTAVIGVCLGESETGVVVRDILVLSSMTSLARRKSKWWGTVPILCVNL